MSLDISGFLRASRALLVESDARELKEEKQRKRLRKAWFMVCRQLKKRSRKLLKDERLKKEEARKEEKTKRKEETKKKEEAKKEETKEETQKEDEAAEEEKEKVVFVKKLLKKSEKRAQIAKYVFEIDFVWLCSRLESKGSCCEICGKALEFKSRKKGGSIPVRLFREFPWNASLDQIVHGGGYTRDNIQVTHVTCNLMKLDMEMEEFVSLCEKIAVLHKQQNPSLI